MEGLDKFREAFKDFSDNYVIIGGTACDITMTGTEVRARATHDIDMIIVVERMTPQYGERFWQFIREAGYRPEKQSKIDFWVFGHSHYNIDKVIGNTSCLSNQLGYVFHDEHKTFNHGKYFNIE